jgi:hypothetical protein
VNILGFTVFLGHSGQESLSCCLEHAAFCFIFLSLIIYVFVKELSFHAVLFIMKVVTALLMKKVPEQSPPSGPPLLLESIDIYLEPDLW